MASLTETYAPVAPTLVVEAISPSSLHHDTGDKFTAYEAHGVMEYWLLDPESRCHRFFRREGEFLEEFAKDAEIIRSASIPGFFVVRSWLDSLALPKVSDCLAELLRG